MIDKKLISDIAKNSVKKVGEKLVDEKQGNCAKISKHIIDELGKIGISAVVIYVTEGKVVGDKYGTFETHYYAFIPKENLVIDTQLWQLKGKPDNLNNRKVVFDWNEYNKIFEPYETQLWWKNKVTKSIKEIIRQEIQNILNEATAEELKGDAPNYLNNSSTGEKVKKTPGTFYKGIEMGDTIVFESPSFTTPGTVYTQKIQLLDLKRLIQKYKKTRKPIEIVRAAIKGEISVNCDDPSFLFWGFKYKAYKQGYSIDKETRPPIIRNPKLRGSVCKHLSNALYVLPFNTDNITKDLVALGAFK